jgi:four helix bundle protein
MNHKENLDLRERTKEFSLKIIRLYSSLPKRREAQVMGDQVLRSGTSVGAQYRESRQAKSNADFINKLGGCLQELEETHYWLELLTELRNVDAEKIEELLKETNELIAIFITISKKVKSKSQ